MENKNCSQFKKVNSFCKEQRDCPNFEIKHVEICPMCGSKSIKDISIGNTEIKSCEDCPCVWFECIDYSNIQDLSVALGHPQVEQI